MIKILMIVISNVEKDGIERLILIRNVTKTIMIMKMMIMMIVMVMKMMIVKNQIVVMTKIAIDRKLVKVKLKLISLINFEIKINKN